MKYAFIFLLLAASCVSNAFAEPGERSFSARNSSLREQMRAVQHEQAMLQRRQEHSNQPMQGKDGAQAREDGGEPDMQPTETPKASGSDEPHKTERMSPEERRALRRQIDEAGHEIYSPAR